MSDLVDIQDIDEFNRTFTVQKDMVSDIIIQNIRNLREDEQIERFIREIIHDPNRTPHGPTEIADILTSNVHVRGKKVVAAFVLKGKSFPRVKSIKISHQFMKLHQIPSLGLIVLGATGDIQDDAQRDFCQTAKDIGCDHLILDAVGLARLFIAYEKICKEDGLPIDEEGNCPEGHHRSEYYSLRILSPGVPEYFIRKIADVSHAGARRYRVILTINNYYTKEIIREIIRKAVEEIKNCNYSRNQHVRNAFDGHPAQVIWLFIAHSWIDTLIPNWVCTVQWVDPNLDQEYHPLKFPSNEELNGILLNWNESYQEKKEFYKDYFVSKQEILDWNDPFYNKFKDYKRIVDQFFVHNPVALDTEALRRIVNQYTDEVHSAWQETSDPPFPPEECNDYIELCLQFYLEVWNLYSDLKRLTESGSTKMTRISVKRRLESLRVMETNIEYERSKLFP